MARTAGLVLLALTMLALGTALVWTSQPTAAVAVALGTGALAGVALALPRLLPADDRRRLRRDRGTV